MVENFDPSELLPPEVLVTSAGTHLYRIGLSHFPYGWKRRNKFHNPLLITLLNVVFLAKCTTSLLVSEENPELFIFLFDSSYFLNSRIHVNIGASFTIILTLVSQLLHYINYKKNLKPSYLKPFDMISGLVSPKSIGLTNEVKIYKFLKISKQLFFICDIITEKLVPILFLAINISPMIKVCSLKQLILYIIPMNMIYVFNGYFAFSIILYQMVYFYLICYYITIKTKECNNKIRNYIKNRIALNNKKAKNLMTELNSIYSEIEDYNQNFWSQYLFWVWILFAIIINMFLYLAIFSNENFLLRFVSIYGSIVCIFTLILVINSASSVHLEVNRSYQLIYSLTLVKRKLMNNRMLVKVIILLEKKNYSFYLSFQTIDRFRYSSKE
jgi:hypothetical protein